MIGLLACVNYICTRYPASVTSWWRSEAHNRQVGGLPPSKHREGLAVDVVYDGDPPSLEARWLRETFGVRLVRESDHDHFEVGP